jgi:hypothetical protein
MVQLRRRLRILGESAGARLRLLSGEEPEALVERLRQLPAGEASRWLGGMEGLAELLDDPTSDHRNRSGSTSRITPMSCARSNAATATPPARRTTSTASPPSCATPATNCRT